jgi:hypothetical protein
LPSHKPDEYLGSLGTLQDVNFARKVLEDAQRAPRILFRHAGQMDTVALQEAFVSGLSKRDRVLHRRLLQSGGSNGLQIQSLGTFTGFNMVEVPQGISVDDILKALQEHPGMHLPTPQLSVLYNVYSLKGPFRHIWRRKQTAEDNFFAKCHRQPGY